MSPGEAELILGFGLTTPEAVTQAFRKKAMAAHPDRGGTHEEFIRLEEARKVLLASLEKPVVKLNFKFGYGTLCTKCFGRGTCKVYNPHGDDLTVTCICQLNRRFT